MGRSLMQTDRQTPEGQTPEGASTVADAPPDNWVDRHAPLDWRPWLRLSRADRPIGTWLLLLPCWWGIGLAMIADGPEWRDLWIAVACGVGAVLMRGAGCTWNDITDRDIDDKVARTRSRPLPSGKVTRRQAWSFLGLQCLGGLAVLLQFNWFAVLVGVASLATVAVYPFMKRITDWPQLFLGLAFSWGALMGWAAHFGALELAPLLLYSGSILWVIGYDTLYAHQDKEDDALVGVRSTARLFGDRTREWLVALYGAALLFFLVAFANAAVPMPALAGLLAAGAHMWRQIRVLDIDDPDQCLRLFKSNSTVGWLIFLGLLGGGVWATISPNF